MHRLQYQSNDGEYTSSCSSSSLPTKQSKNFLFLKFLYIEDGLEEKVAATHLEDLVFKLLGIPCNFMVVPNCFLGIECCEHTDFDAVFVCGHSLKHIQAFDFLRIFRSVGGLAPVLIMSEYYEEIEIEDYFVEGAPKMSYEFNDPPKFNGKLHKPFTKKEICSTISNIYHFTEAKRNIVQVENPVRIKRSILNNQTSKRSNQHPSELSIERDERCKKTSIVPSTLQVHYYPNQENNIQLPAPDRAPLTFNAQFPIFFPEHSSDAMFRFALPTNEAGVFRPPPFTPNPTPDLLGRSSSIDSMGSNPNSFLVAGELTHSSNYVTTLPPTESDETKTNSYDEPFNQQRKKSKKYHT